MKLAGNDLARLVHFLEAHRGGLVSNKCGQAGGGHDSGDSGGGGSSGGGGLTGNDSSAGSIKGEVGSHDKTFQVVAHCRRRVSRFAFSLGVAGL